MISLRTGLLLYFYLHKIAPFQLHASISSASNEQLAVQYMHCLIL